MSLLPPHSCTLVQFCKRVHDALSFYPGASLLASLHGSRSSVGASWAWYGGSLLKAAALFMTKYYVCSGVTDVKSLPRLASDRRSQSCKLQISTLNLVPPARFVHLMAIMFVPNVSLNIESRQLIFS